MDPRALVCLDFNPVPTLGSGMCNALSGLTSQAIGGKNYKLAGYWFQHALFYFTLASGLMFLMWWQVRLCDGHTLSWKRATQSPTWDKYVCV